MYPTVVVAYLALFLLTAALFIGVNLLVGRFLRPNAPDAEKLSIYECGEPTIGSSFVQFDLRFYVVALLFLIFDVEVAFFFPWATVFGKANALSAESSRQVAAEQVDDGFQSYATGILGELGFAPRTIATDDPTATLHGARRLAWLSLADLLVFFAVLMVGFFYVWKRGDLEWVRSTEGQTAAQRAPPVTAPQLHVVGSEEELVQQ